MAEGLIRNRRLIALLHIQKWQICQVAKASSVTFAYPG